jgi:hypothetical protein
MKTILFRSFMLLTATCAAASASDFIRQIQMINNALVVTDFPVFNSSGEVMSRALDADLSVFQLYAEHVKSDGSVEILKLDEKSVGTFLPEVTLETFSEDPHVPTRTRADQPYGVRVTVGGLLDGEMIPDYAKSIILERRYRLFSPETYLFNGMEGEYDESQIIQQNGTFVDSQIFQLLPAISPIRALGEETFTACVHPEAGASLAELTSATVTVWPVATARIDGIHEGALYRNTPVSGSYILKDAYPSSRTYAQIYEGPANLGTVGAVIENSVVEYGGNGETVPQNAQVVLGDFSEHITKGGTYTIEVITVTPFNQGARERIARVTFLVDRTISVNSMVTTFE